MFTFSVRGTLGRRSVVERESVSVEEEFDTGASGEVKNGKHMVRYLERQSCLPAEVYSDDEEETV